MATLTKAQLAQQLEASHVAYEKLKSSNASILAQIAALQRPAAAKPAAVTNPEACPKCSGTGKYVSEFTDAPGICYACEGKGYQLASDQRRNWGYAKHRAKDAISQKATPTPHKATTQATGRADAIKAYFTANPGARSVTPEQLEEFSHASA